jgi:hypothetical protein
MRRRRKMRMSFILPAILLSLVLALEALKK